MSRLGHWLRTGMFLLQMETAGTWQTRSWISILIRTSTPVFHVSGVHAGLSNILKGEGGGSKTTSNNLAPNQPIFQFNAKTWCYGNSKNSSLSMFRTVAEVIGDFSAKRTRFKGRPCNGIPGTSRHFLWRSDAQYNSLNPHRYIVEFSLFAQLNSTNATVGIASAESAGSIVNFNVDLDPALSSITDEALYLHLTASRSRAVQVLVVFIVVANCKSTFNMCDIVSKLRHCASGQGLPLSRSCG